MTRFLLKRLGYTLTLVVLSASLAYVLAGTYLNPRARFQGRNPPQPEAAIDSVLTSLNMNDKTPLITRVGVWASGVVRGDLGLTIYSQPVSEEIGRRMWVSLRLMLLGAILGAVIGVAGGAYAAVKQYRAFDHLFTMLSFLILSTPVLVLAEVFKYIGIGINNALGFTGSTKLFYTLGEITPGVDPWTFAGVLDRLGHLALPTFVLAWVGIAFYGRYQRNAMLDVLGGDFVRTAQAKGLRRTTALIRHGLRTALIPMVTFFAYQFALLFVGATFTEKIFGWHGMGEFFVDSVRNSDVNSVAGVALFVAVLVLIAGMLADLIYAALDPRVRIE
jgi:peptide/nickel transport system permease protein